MRAAAFFVAFFFLFTFALLAVPVPMFPGNIVDRWFTFPYINAIANGLTYGFVTWLIFFFVSKRIDKT